MYAVVTMKMPYMKNMFYTVLPERQAKDTRSFERLQKACEHAYGAEFVVFSAPG